MTTFMSRKRTQDPYQCLPLSSYGPAIVRQNTGTTVLSSDVCHSFSGKSKESTPMCLTPIKNGEQIAWLKQSGREEDSEQTGDEYEDFMRRLEMSDCSITSDESERSKTENTPPLSSVGQKQTLEGNVQLKFTSQSPIKKRSEQKQPKLQENEDTLVENVNEVIVGDRRMISEKTTKGNVQLKFTSQSPIQKRSEQKQPKLQQIEDTLEENVNEESVSDTRMISEKTTKGNVELEFTPQSPIKNRSVQKQRETLQNNNEESVSDGRVISENTTEGNAELEFTSQSPIKKRSEQKQRKLIESEDTLEDNVNEGSVDDGIVISEDTTEGNVELEFISQSPIKKRSELKQRKLQESEDTLEDNVNEEIVDEKRTMSEETLEGNGRFEFTSPSPIKKASERKLQESEDTLEENVDEESVDERRIISEKTVEGNGRSKFTSPSPSKKTCEQNQRKLQGSEDILQGNVNEESVDERRIISEQLVEGNGRFESTSQSPSKKKRSDRKRRKVEDEDTLKENVHEDSAAERRLMSEETLKGNGRFEFTSSSPIKKRSEQKQRKLQESEDTLEENVNEESVDERRVISEKTLEGNGRFEFTSPSPIKKTSEQKQRKLRESEDILEEDLNLESVNERIISEQILKGNGRFESTSQSPNKKKRSDRKRQKVEDEDALKEKVHEEKVDERRIILEKTLEGNGRFKFTSPSPNKKRSEQKQRKLKESEDALEENVNEESVSDTAITSKKRVQNNVELECAAKDHVNNNNNIKIAVKRQAAKRKWGVLRESDSQAAVGMETPKKSAREDGCCEDKRNDECKKTYDRKTVEGAKNFSDGRQEGNQIETLKKNKKNKKKKRGKRKEKSELCGTESKPESTPTSFLEEVEPSQSKDEQDGRVEGVFASNVKNKHQISNAKAKKGSDCDLVQKQESLAFTGAKNLKKKDRYWEEKHSEDDEKSNDRKTSNQEEKVNNRDDQVQKESYAKQSKKKKGRKEKKGKDELNSMESVTELPSSLNLETVTSDSLDDSGYGENGHNKSKQHEQCVPERVESVHQPLISKKRKAAAHHEKETPSGQGLLV